eukprot:904621-Amorphochlora_amoeboformis.AAC.1
MTQEQCLKESEMFLELSQAVTGLAVLSRTCLSALPGDRVVMKSRSDSVESEIIRGVLGGVPMQEGAWIIKIEKTRMAYSSHLGDVLSVEQECPQPVLEDPILADPSFVHALRELISPSSEKCFGLVRNLVRSLALKLSFLIIQEDKSEEKSVSRPAPVVSQVPPGQPPSLVRGSSLVIPVFKPGLKRQASAFTTNVTLQALCSTSITPNTLCNRLNLNSLIHWANCAHVTMQGRQVLTCLQSATPFPFSKTPRLPTPIQFEEKCKEGHEVKTQIKDDEQDLKIDLGLEVKHLDSTKTKMKRPEIMVPVKPDDNRSFPSDSARILPLDEPDTLAAFDWPPPTQPICRNERMATLSHLSDRQLVEFLQSLYTSICVLRASIALEPISAELERVGINPLLWHYRMCRQFGSKSHHQKVLHRSIKIIVQRLQPTLLNEDHVYQLSDAVWEDISQGFQALVAANANHATQIKVTRTSRKRASSKLEPEKATEAAHNNRRDSLKQLTCGLTVLELLLRIAPEVEVKRLTTDRKTKGLSLLATISAHAPSQAAKSFAFHILGTLMEIVMQPQHSQLPLPRFPGSLTGRAHNVVNKKWVKNTIANKNLPAIRIQRQFRFGAWQPPLVRACGSYLAAYALARPKAVRIQKLKLLLHLDRINAFVRTTLPSWKNGAEWCQEFLEYCDSQKKLKRDKLEKALLSLSRDKKNHKIINLAGNIDEVKERVTAMFDLDAMYVQVATFADFVSHRYMLYVIYN